MSNAVQHLTGNYRTGVKPVLAAGTTSTVSTTNAIQSSIKGKSYTRAALTNQATPTTDKVTGAAFPALSANQGTMVILGVDTGGNIVAAQGSIEPLDGNGAFINLPQPPPPLPNDCAPWGYILLKAGSTLSGTWRFGTNNLSSVTGMTYTFGDLDSYPNRPISS